VNLNSEIREEIFENLVSIIMPTHNSEKYIKESINSALNQTYKNWELIIVDDNSNDNTKGIIDSIEKNCEKIKYTKFNMNRGAAQARNEAINKAKGRFLAFLDSDDLWDEKKLETQVSFMLENNIHFSFTDYEVIDSDGTSLNKIIKMPRSLNYNQYLSNTIIQTVTVIIDTKYIKDIYMPPITRRQDFACWLSILKNNEIAYSINMNLGKYRRARNSLSSNKINAVKGTWYVYRKIEKLSYIKSIYVFIGYAYNACKKRIYFKKYIRKFNEFVKI